MALGSLVGAGEHSMPWPEVSAAGAPPVTETFQRWRRSISLLVGRENDLAVSPAASATSSTSNVAGREEHRLAAGGGDGVQMRPAIGLPREDEAAALGPQNLIARVDAAEDAARAFAGAEDFAPGAGLHGGDADGPRLAGAVRLARTYVIRWKAREERRRCGRRATIRARCRNRCWGRDSAAWRAISKTPTRRDRRARW